MSSNLRFLKMVEGVLALLCMANSVRQRPGFTKLPDFWHEDAV